jgi:hypothetical protein
MLMGMLFSCKKENVPADEQVKRPVTIRVSDFVTRHENLRSANGRANADSSLADITDLYYICYTYAGYKVHEMHQDSSDANFGTFTDSLIPGDYGIILVASQKPLVWHTATGNMEHHFMDPGMASATTWLPYKDVFFKSENITVPANGNPVVMDLTLNRLIGKVQVNILDALPADHPNSALSVTVINPAASVQISSGYAWDKSWNTTMNMTRVNQNRFENFMFGYNDEDELRIDYKDKYTGAPRQKVISNIAIWPNRKTIITGNLYGAPNAGFQIKVNQSWSSDSTVVHF